MLVGVGIGNGIGIVLNQRLDGVSPHRGNCLRSATEKFRFCHVDGLVGEGLRMDNIGDAFERW